MTPYALLCQGPFSSDPAASDELSLKTWAPWPASAGASPAREAHSNLTAWQAWDVAVVLHLLSQTVTAAKGPAEEEGLSSPSAVLEGDIGEPFGGPHVPQPAADRFAACTSAAVLVSLCLLLSVLSSVEDQKPVDGLHMGALNEALLVDWCSASEQHPPSWHCCSGCAARL